MRYIGVCTYQASAARCDIRRNNWDSASASASASSHRANDSMTIIPISSILPGKILETEYTGKNRHGVGAGHTINQEPESKSISTLSSSSLSFNSRPRDFID